MATDNKEAARKFGEALARFAKAETPERARLLHRRLTLEALTRIVRRTPVDTGRARGNWQTSVGAPATGVIDEVDPQTAAGSTRSQKLGDFNPAKSTAVTRDVGAVVARGIDALDPLKPFGVTFIANNLVYIEPLENGHSKQAPEGMVAVTLAEIAAGLNLAADEQLGGTTP